MNIFVISIVFFMILIVTKKLKKRFFLSSRRKKKKNKMSSAQSTLKQETQSTLKQETQSTLKQETQSTLKQETQSTLKQETQNKENAIPVIHVGGSVSSGKSSFVNALLGIFARYVGKSRISFEILKYSLRKILPVANEYYPKKIDEQNSNDKKEFENFMKTKTNENSLSDEKINELISQISKIKFEDEKFISSDFEADIVDFPGFNDVNGTIKKKDIFLEAYLNNLISCDIAIYVIDCNSPFLRDDDVKALKTIQEKIKNNYRTEHKYCELFIVATKYDTEDEEIMDMWKKVDVGVKKENIFFVGCHQLFIHRCESLVYLPKSCENELKKMFSLFNGYAKKMKCKFNELISKKEFIDEKYWNVEKNGDWNDLVPRLKSFCIGLQIRRIQPVYDALMKIWKDDVYDLYFYNTYYYDEYIVGENILKTDQTLTIDFYFNIRSLNEVRARNTKVFSSDVDPKRKKQINVSIEENINSRDEKFYTNEFPTEEEARYRKALMSVVYKYRYEYPSLNFPLLPLRFEDYIKVYNDPSSLDKFHDKIYTRLKDKILALKGTKFYDEFFKNIFRSKQNIVERLLVTYISSKFGKYYESIGNYVCNSPHIYVKYQALLLGNFLERSKTFPENERKRLMSQFTKEQIMKYFKESSIYETPLFDISKFKFDDEFELLKMFYLKNMTFDTLTIAKFFRNKKYSEQMKKLSEEFRNRIEYYIHIRSEEKIIPIIFCKIDDRARVDYFCNFKSCEDKYEEDSEEEEEEEYTLDKE